jgi:hypothetical protein
MLAGGALQLQPGALTFIFDEYDEEVTKSYGASRVSTFKGQADP